MSDVTSPDGDEDRLLAAEYVLRLLDTSEKALFEARLAREPALRDEISTWSAHFSGLDTEFATDLQRAALKAELMARLFGIPAPAVSFWQRLGLWQGLSFASILLACFFAWQVAQLGPVDTPARGPLYVSEIVAQDQSLRVLAVFDSDTAALQINRTAGQAASGRALELWAIRDGNAPVSLGVLPQAQVAQISLPDEFQAQIDDLTLAISDEPAGGSATGQPTGAVLAVGTVTEF